MTKLAEIEVPDEVLRRFADIVVGALEVAEHAAWYQPGNARNRPTVYVASERGLLIATCQPPFLNHAPKCDAHIVVWNEVKRPTLSFTTFLSDEVIANFSVEEPSFSVEARGLPLISQLLSFANECIARARYR